MNYKQKLGKTFMQESFKITKKRKLIADYACSIHKHFTVDDVFDYFKVQKIDLSMATIYRTLALLEASKLIKKTVKNGGKEHYEHIYGHSKHFHIVCKICGKIVEKQVSLIKAYLLDIGIKEGFILDSYDIELTGVCKKCQRKVK